jgi:hypothetical protein
MKHLSSTKLNLESRIKSLIKYDRKLIKHY